MYYMQDGEYSTQTEITWSRRKFDKRIYDIKLQNGIENQLFYYKDLYVIYARWRLASIVKNENYYTLPNTIWYLHLRF